MQRTCDCYGQPLLLQKSAAPEYRPLPLPSLQLFLYKH